MNITSATKEQKITAPYSLVASKKTWVFSFYLYCDIWRFSGDATNVNVRVNISVCIYTNAGLKRFTHDQPHYAKEGRDQRIAIPIQLPSNVSSVSSMKIVGNITLSDLSFACRGHQSCDFRVGMKGLKLENSSKPTKSNLSYAQYLEEIAEGKKRVDATKKINEINQAVATYLNTRVNFLKTWYEAKADDKIKLSEQIDVLDHMDSMLRKKKDLMHLIERDNRNVRRFMGGVISERFKELAVYEDQEINGGYNRNTMTDTNFVRTNYMLSDYVRTDEMDINKLYMDGFAMREISNYIELSGSRMVWARNLIKVDQLNLCNALHRVTVTDINGTKDVVCYLTKVQKKVAGNKNYFIVGCIETSYDNRNRGDGVIWNIISKTENGFTVRFKETDKDNNYFVFRYLIIGSF